MAYAAVHMGFLGPSQMALHTARGMGLATLALDMPYSTN